MKAFNIFTIFLVIVSLFVSVVLGLLLVESSKKNTELQAKVDTFEEAPENPVNEDDTGEDVVPVEEGKVHYSDESMGFEFDYPESWELSTRLTLDNSGDAFDPRKKISNFQVDLSKGSVTMNLFFLTSGGNELYLDGINNSDVEQIVELNSNVFRVNAEGNEWRYFTKEDCIPAIGGDVCGQRYHRQSNSAVYFIVTVNDTNDTVLEEVDQIFLSLFN